VPASGQGRPVSYFVIKFCLLHFPIPFYFSVVWSSSSYAGSFLRFSLPLTDPLPILDFVSVTSLASNFIFQFWLLWFDFLFLPASEVHLRFLVPRFGFGAQVFVFPVYYLRSCSILSSLPSFRGLDS
jgi:hypothetical protein